MILEKNIKGRQKLIVQVLFEVVRGCVSKQKNVFFFWLFFKTVFFRRYCYSSLQTYSEDLFGMLLLDSFSGNKMFIQEICLPL